MERYHNNGVVSAVTLTIVGSVLSGIIIASALAALFIINGADIDGYIILAAYLAGSIGFVLSAPLKTYFRMTERHQITMNRRIGVWLLTVMAINALAVITGIILVFATQSLSDSHAGDTGMAASFLSGVFLLFVSGGIHWLAYRKVSNIDNRP